MGLVEHDDHWELPLAGRTVTRLLIDFGFGLQFWWQTDDWTITLGRSFILRSADHDLTVIPGDMASAGPALECFGKIATSVRAFKDGRLEIAFDGGTRLDASPDPDYEAWELSGGDQQKAIIGRWLLTNPKVLLLDDPTRGVDVGAKAELYALMDRLCRSGLGIIVTSSELPELLTLCDRILVLSEGRLTGQLSRAEATEERIMELATSRNENLGEIP